MSSPKFVRDADTATPPGHLRAHASAAVVDTARGQVQRALQIAKVPGAAMDAHDAIDPQALGGDERIEFAPRGESRRRPTALGQVEQVPRADAAAALSPRCHVLRVSSLLEAALVALSEEAPVERTDRVDHLSWLILDEIARAPMTRLALPLPGEARLAALARALIADPGSVRTIDQWGEEMGMSRRTLTRRFRTQTGVSFGEWRRRLRLLSAAARVAEGQPLAKVVADLGYRNVAAFRAMARRHLGERFDELAGEA